MEQPKQNKSTAKNELIKQLLKAIPKEDLMDFVEDNLKNDNELKNQFLITFDHLIEGKSKSFYKSQIKAVLRKAKGRQGFIWRSEMRVVLNQLQPMLNKAEKHIETHKFEDAFFIATAMLEEMTPALDYADDSDGAIGFLVRSAMDVLYDLASPKLPSKVRANIYQYCLGAYQKKLFRGWDWHLEILKVANRFSTDEKEGDAILELLKVTDKDNHKDSVLALTLELLMSHKSPDIVADFITKHKHSYDVRKVVIEAAYKRNDFATVVDFASFGIKHDKQRSDIVSNEWYDWLLRVAQAENDATKIIPHARHLLIASIYPQQDYFAILKAHVGAKDWHLFRDELVADILSSERWGKVALAQKIYVAEEMWDHLLNLLKTHGSIHMLIKNEVYLKENYRESLIELYQDFIIDSAAESKKRSHYRAVSKYILRMRKLGAVEESTFLVNYLADKYRLRSAFLEELSRI